MGYFFYMMNYDMNQSFFRKYINPLPCLVVFFGRKSVPFNGIDLFDIFIWYSMK